MTVIVRIALIATLLFAPATGSLVGADTAPAAEEPAVTCESERAPDDGDVRIGSAIVMGRGEAAARVAAACDGTLTTR